MHMKPSAAVEEEAAQELHGIESHDALTAAVAIRGQFIGDRSYLSGWTSRGEATGGA